MAHTLDLHRNCSSRHQTLSAHCIPAYPEYNSATTFDAAFYTERQACNDELAGAITLTDFDMTYTVPPVLDSDVNSGICSGLH